MSNIFIHKLFDYSRYKGDIITSNYQFFKQNICASDFCWTIEYWHDEVVWYTPRIEKWIGKIYRSRDPIQLQTKMFDGCDRNITRVCRKRSTWNNEGYP